MMTQNQRVKKNKIIKIKRSNRFSDRIIITLENKSVFRVPEDVFASKPLHVGDNITNKDINDYDSKMRLQEAKDAAFRLLSFRMRSICEMRKRLKQKSFTESEIDQVINKLIKLDYLNDTSFAKIFINEKIKTPLAHKILFDQIHDAILEIDIDSNEELIFNTETSVGSIPKEPISEEGYIVLDNFKPKNDEIL